MQGLLKYLSPTFGRDSISDCAESLLNLKRMKETYPPENREDKAMVINLKA